MMFLDGGLQLPSHRSAIIRFSSYIYNSRVFCRAWKVRSGRLTQPASWYWWLSSTHTSASTGPGESETKVKVTQSCPTLCESMDYTVHGILQVRILEWVAFPFSQGSSRPRSQTGVSCIVGGFFSNWATRKTWVWGCKYLLSSNLSLIYLPQRQEGRAMFQVIKGNPSLPHPIPHEYDRFWWL